MATFDERIGMWFDFRRFVTGRGATAADKAEAALRAQVASVRPVKQIRRGLLSEAELRHVIGERK